MVSDNQRQEMINKLVKVLALLPTSKNISELSTKTGIPTSTIQRYLNNKNLLIEAKLFLYLKAKNVDEISLITGFPIEDIENYLNSKTEFIEILLDAIVSSPSFKDDCEEAFSQNRDWLVKAKREGTIRGGKISQASNGYSKDENGKFTGSGKRR